ncbi:hypothetical protein BH09PSE4_BH09PSE4_03460 [soil metagenome]
MTSPGAGPGGVPGSTGLSWWERQVVVSHQETDTMIITVIAATLAFAASDKPDPSAYPDLSQERLLPAIIADLRRTLPDPYSIRDLIVCPAHHIKVENGHPVRWAVSFALNAKNASGGYTGLSSYLIGFKNGRINLHASPTLMAGTDALDAMINRAIMKNYEKCPTIPDAKVQELLAAPATGGN